MSAATGRIVFNDCRRGFFPAEMRAAKRANTVLRSNVRMCLRFELVTGFHTGLIEELNLDNADVRMEYIL
jgi:hypothetical protein